VAFRNAATFVHDELKKSGLFSNLERDHVFSGDPDYEFLDDG